MKDEKEQLKKAIRVGMSYGENRGVVKFDATDSADHKVEYIYRLLVHDKLITPLPSEQLSMSAMKHKLALWASKLKA
jgi:predicted transcriptional regulator